jgi:adenine-specific DNA-methyltransferase
MITPRLKLLKELLHEEGVILVSIDDNEDSHLRVLMDEIFGEENFVAQLVWEKGRKNDAKLFSVGHEYIVVYARSRETLRVKNIIWREEKSGAREIQEEYLRLRKLHGANNVKIQSAVREYYKSLPKTHPAKKHSRYGNVDDRGIWRDDNMSWPGGGGPAYDVIHPRTKKPCAVPEGGWRYSSPERLQDMIKAGVVVFREDETEPPIRKTYLIRSNSPFSDDSVPDEDGDDIGIQVAGSYFYRSALQASNLLVQLFGKKIFENPKDHEVLKRLIRYVTQNEKEAIILDSFAGSGTTAHAVLALNKEDGGNRKFILVECELDSILDGKNLPSYLELARYVFYTATGEEFDERKVNEKRSFVGESKTHEVYLFYQPDMDYLKKTALTLERAESLGKMKDKRRLVFAPTKYLDQEQLDALRIDFAQLPFEIYKLAQ